MITGQRHIALVETHLALTKMPGQNSGNAKNASKLILVSRNSEATKQSITRISDFYTAIHNSCPVRARLKRV